MLERAEVCGKLQQKKDLAQNGEMAAVNLGSQMRNTFNRMGQTVRKAKPLNWVKQQSGTS